MSDYVPIETNAERRAKKVQNAVKAIDNAIDRADAHLTHRLSLKTIGKEVFAHFTDKVIPHGADEIGNVLFSGSAYLPWPGQGGPKPIQAPQIEALAASTIEAPVVGTGEGPDNPYVSGSGYSPPSPEGGPSGLYLPDPGPFAPSRIPPSGGPDLSTNPYLTGGTTPEPHDHNSVYGVQSYQDAIKDSIQRGANDPDRGMSR